MRRSAQHYQLLKTSSRGYVIDTFTLGDKLETVHTQITYHVYIDITKTDSEPILFKDNETLEEFIQYYQETPNKVTSTDLRKLVKMSYPDELENGYNHPGLVEYCDKGINDGITYELVEMNQTEYVILVSNPFKVNPAVNSFTTPKPEKPYIHSVEYEKTAEENFKIEDQNDVADVTWYSKIEVYIYHLISLFLGKIYPPNLLRLNLVHMILISHSLQDHYQVINCLELRNIL